MDKNQLTSPRKRRESESELGNELELLRPELQNQSTPVPVSAAINIFYRWYQRAGGGSGVVGFVEKGLIRGLSECVWTMIGR